MMGHPGIALVIVAFACLGCGGDRAPDPATREGRLALAELPGALAAADRGLQAELALVKQQRGLPLDLAPALPSGESNRSQAAHQLDQAFPPLSRSLVRSPLDSIYAGGSLALSTVQIERGRDLVRKHAAACEAFRAALPREPGGFGARLCDGMLADLAFLEPLDLGCRLEAVAAAVRIADGEPAEALPHLRTLLTTARILATEPNVTTRVAAAHIRRSALAVLAAIVAHDHCSADLHQELFDLLSAETSQWPADSHAWFGDRAAGLLTYELVREGHYLSLLAADEVQRLASQQNLEATARAAVRNIDADERFYLQAMRRLIDACQQPYCQRIEVLSAIRRDLRDQEQSSDYPLVAGTLLLADFELAQRHQAEDFARSQAWMIALGTALGRESTAPVTNSLTGQPYRVDRTPLAVTVADVLPEHDEVCQVPLPPPRQARR
jgi:hypothetical protein